MGEKAILIIDMPKSCEECPLLNGADECILQDEDVNFLAETWDELRAGCPIKELPKKKTHDCTDPVFMRGAKNGYNACIDEILKD